MTSKRKKASKQLKTRHRASVQNASDVHDVSDDNTVPRSDEECSSERVFCTEEFSDPFDLSNIEDGVRQQMLLAAPMLMGRDAEYGSQFFTGVVGLCDKGPLLKDVSKSYNFITDDEIAMVWKTGVQKGRYEFSKCEDDDQLKTFGQHYFKVYGNRPHNNYFCLRFLRGCFASFIYGKAVNWCAEALDRHQARQKSVSRNPSKLGPVATRCQVEGLCRIIKEQSGLGKGPAPSDYPCGELKAALDMEQQKIDAVKSVEQRLHEIRQRYYASLERMRGESSESAEEELNANYVLKLKEARQILRREGATVLYKNVIAESEALYKDLAVMREADAQIRQQVVDLELQVNSAERDLEVVNKDLQVCKAAVTAARMQMLTLKTPRVFEYPKLQSIPPLGFPGKETCAYCGRGFIWKAAVLSSCGCFLHPPCAAEIVSCQSYRCKICKDILLASSPIHLSEVWVAQFGGELNAQQKTECTSFEEVLKAASESISAPAFTGTKS